MHMRFVVNRAFYAIDGGPKDHILSGLDHGKSRRMRDIMEISCVSYSVTERKLQLIY